MKKTKMLKKNYEFRRILSKGKYYSGKYIECFILKINKKNNYLGIALSTRVGKAVKRNYIRRLIRENYKEIEMQIQDGYSIIFLWKKAADVEKATFNNIKNDMFYILDKSNILEKLEN